MRNEALFLALDGGMILVAISLVSFVHPCIFFPYFGIKSKIRKEFEEMDQLPLTGPQHPPQSQGQHYGYQ